jgi:hypothetical protein
VDHPKDTGDRSTFAIMYALRLEGYAILVPFGENTRYDLVIDDGKRLRRVQCKTGRLRDGGVTFRTCSSYAHHPNPPKIVRRDYHGQVEEFAVFCPELGAVYLTPIEDLPNKAMATLRVRPSRNRQRARIRMAAQYELPRIDVY